MADKTKPSSKEVKDFHENDDVDGSDKSHHHTLGPGIGQAAPGQHFHDGGSSPLLLSDVKITGSRGGNTALASVISVLVALGATDQTTA